MRKWMNSSNIIPKFGTRRDERNALKIITNNFVFSSAEPERGVGIDRIISSAWRRMHEPAYINYITVLGQGT